MNRPFVLLAIFRILTNAGVCVIMTMMTENKKNSHIGESIMAPKGLTDQKKAIKTEAARGGEGAAGLVRREKDKRGGYHKGRGDGQGTFFSILIPRRRFSLS
jgi:hypothetical protein